LMSLFKLLDFVEKEWSEQGEGMDGVLIPCHLTSQKVQEQLARQCDLFIRRDCRCTCLIVSINK